MDWYELTTLEKTIEFPMFEGLTVPAKWLNVEFAPTTVDLHDEIQVEPTWSIFRISFNPKDPQSFDLYDNIFLRKREKLLPRFKLQNLKDPFYDWMYSTWCAGWVTEDEFLNIPKVLSYIDNIAGTWKVRLALRSKFSTGAATPAAMTPVSVPRLYGKKQAFCLLL